ncbi:MAG TPA: PsbP-related protein [Patescibacteria group bacterium]|nr:PsbP-related protein [Patescibacteria group bacterium]
MTTKGQNQKKQLVFLLFIILLNVILWNKLYVTKKQIYKNQRISDVQQEQQIHWKTYTDKKIDFAFQYPSTWIRQDDECASEPFCLIVIDYNYLLTEKQRNKYSLDVYPERGDIRVFTKEQFTQFTADLEKGTMPQTILKGWNFVKIAGKNGIQNVFFDFFSGTYIIETIVSQDNNIIQIALVLPVEPFIDQNIVNIEKSEQKVEDLKQKKFDTATQKLINQYNQLLSTFTFTKSDFVFYQESKTNLSFYYPSRYGSIVKRSFKYSTDFHFSDLHFPGNPNRDIDEYYNSLTVYSQQEYPDYDKIRSQLFDQYGFSIYNSQGETIKWNEPDILNEPQEEKQKRLERQSKKIHIQSEVIGTDIDGMYYFMRSGNGVTGSVNLIFELLTEKGEVIKIDLNLWSNEQSVLEQQLNTIFKPKFGGTRYDEVAFNRWEKNMNDFVQNQAFFVFKKELEEMKILVESLQLP